MTTIHAAKRNWDLHREAGHSCYSRYCPANFDDLESYLDFLGISGSDSNEPESGHQNPVNENPVRRGPFKPTVRSQTHKDAAEENNSGAVEDDATVVELLLRLTEACERAAASLHSIERVLEKRLKRPY